MGNFPAFFLLFLFEWSFGSSGSDLFVAGKLSCEGKVEHKFDMEPHSDNLANYGKLCRERTQKYMVKSRQVQVECFDSCIILPYYSIFEVLWFTNMTLSDHRYLTMTTV